MEDPLLRSKSGPSAPALKPDSAGFLLIFNYRLNITIDYTVTPLCKWVPCSGLALFTTVYQQITGFDKPDLWQSVDHQEGFIVRRCDLVGQHLSFTPKGSCFIFGSILEKHN